MSDPVESEPAVAELLVRVDADAEVVGVILTGSKAREGMATPNSDTDVLLVVTPEGRRNWRGSHSAQLDIGIYTVDELSTPALAAVNAEEWWNRFAFAHARVLRDSLDGRVGEWVLGQATLSAVETEIIAPEYLDGYINCAVRSLKSTRDGRPREATLDAVESVAWLLTTIFALEGRIRPYNKYLPWELAHFPLDAPEFAADRLLLLLDAVISESDGAAQRELFGAVSAAARTAGHGDVIDDWGDDLAVFS